MKTEISAVLALLAVFFVLSLTSMKHKTVTYDESHHFAYGMKILKGDPSRPVQNSFMSSTMPFSAFNALPIKNHQNPQIPGAPRLVTVLFSLLLALTIYLWARSLYGIYSAFLSLLIYIFSPDMLAHSQLVTTDLFAALMTTAVFFSFWAFMKKRSPARMALRAALLGLSQLAKYSAVYFYPILAGIVFLKALPWLIKNAAQKNCPSR